LVVTVLESRNFRVNQDLPVGDGYADVYGERDDVQIVIEMKRRDKFHTRGLRELARKQAKKYAKVLKPLYVGISDGQTLIIEFKGRRCTHQIGSGFVLQANKAAPCPLDIGMDYGGFRTFPKRQRQLYEFKGETVVQRSAIFDLAAFVHGNLDVAFVSGEPGAGKTTYGWQLANSPDWDPLWLDGSLLRSDPLHTLDQARRQITGFTGDLASFLTTLYAYRERYGEVPTGVIVDAADEWENVYLTLPALLRFAKSVKLKVVVLGRPQTIDTLIDAETLLRGFSVTRHDLGTFNDDEWGRAEAHYIAAFRLKSGFGGRAKQMSLLPEMMAMIATAYQGARVNPNLTEEELYDRYRRKKCAAIAKTGQSVNAAQGAINDMALAMLKADSVNLPYSLARQTTDLVDALINEGVLRSEGAERQPHVRFRFGRLRDDALRSQPTHELFEKPIVGRSALTYIALRDRSRRAEYIRLALEESDIEAVCLVRENGWWADLAAVPAGAIRKPYTILAYAREKLREFPELITIAGGDPDTLRLASVFHAEAPLPVWKAWLASSLDQEHLDDITSLTLTMLRSGAVPLPDAISAVDLIRSRVFHKAAQLHEGHSFWRLVGEICERLTASEARRFLRRTIPAYSIVHSSHGQMAAFYHGLSYASDMLAAVERVRSRSTPRAFEAWASVALLTAMSSEWPGFKGREWVGSDGDNGWLLDAILPSLKTILANDSVRAKRLLLGYKVSDLHPAFRLRAYIMAAPIAALEAIPARTLAWRRQQSTGLPALYETLDSRAEESAMITEQALDDAMSRFGAPISEPQVIAFHRKLAAGSKRATTQAFTFVADRAFPGRDMFRLNFFAHLDWTSKRPLVATRLLVAALLAGYNRLFLIHQKGYNDVVSLALTDRRVRKLLSKVPGITDTITEAFHSAPLEVRSRLAVPLYEDSGDHGKRTILRWSHELPMDVAVQVVRRGLDDEANVPEASSSDDEVGSDNLSMDSFHADVWVALVMCYQKWPDRWFHDLGVDIVELARVSKAPRAVAATVRPVANYGSELWPDRSVATKVIDYLCSVGKSAGPNLRGFTANQLARFYGIMTADEREQFFGIFIDTEEAATAAFYVARHKCEDKAALDRALLHARDNPHRSAIASVLWREVHSEPRVLTLLESLVVDALIGHADAETIQQLAHLAISLSKSSAATGTAMLLRVAERAIDAKVMLHAPYEMQFDWSSVGLDDLERAVASAGGGYDVGYSIVQIIVSGLSSKTEPTDTVRTMNAFEALVTPYDYVREDYASWRASLSRA
jgi:hypothetical protein